jgi:hypothetical protein
MVGSRWRVWSARRQRGEADALEMPGVRCDWANASRAMERDEELGSGGGRGGRVDYAHPAQKGRRSGRGERWWRAGNFAERSEESARRELQVGVQVN